MFIFLKVSSIWLSMPTHLSLFNAICPQRLNRVSRRLKRIDEEETGYHKPFSSFTTNYRTRFWIIMRVVQIVLCVCTFQVRPNIVWNFEDEILLRGENVTPAFFIFHQAECVAFLHYKIVFLVTIRVKLLLMCLCE